MMDKRPTLFYFIKSVFHREDYKRRRVAATCLHHDISPVFFDSALTYKKFISYLLITFSITDFSKHIFLPCRQLLINLLARREENHLLQKLLRKIVITVLNRRERHFDLLEVTTLEQEAAHTQVDKAGVILPIAIHREDDNLDVRVSTNGKLRSLHPVHLGHGDIHEDDIGRSGDQMIKEFLPVACLKSDICVTKTAKKGTETGTEKLMVVNKPYIHGQEVFYWTKLAIISQRQAPK